MPDATPPGKVPEKGSHCATPGTGGASVAEGVPVRDGVDEKDGAGSAGCIAAHAAASEAVMLEESSERTSNAGAATAALT